MPRLRWRNSSTPRSVWHIGARGTRTRGPYTTRSARRLRCQRSSTRPYEPTSVSTMGTWPSWRRTAWPPTPRRCWPPTTSRAFGSMTYRRWQPSAKPQPDAGTTPAGMAMAGVAHSGLEAFQTHVASRVGTSQEGEAMIFVSYIRRLA